MLMSFQKKIGLITSFFIIYLLIIFCKLGVQRGGLGLEYKWYVCLFLFEIFFKKKYELNDGAQSEFLIILKMIFPLKQLVRHMVVFGVLTLLVEVGLSLWEAYPTNADTFWNSLFQLLWQVLVDFAQKVLNMEWMEFKMVQWTIWMTTEKIYLTILVLISMIIYYNIRTAGVKEPKPSPNRQITIDKYDEKKKKETKDAVNNLVSSPEYAKYLSAKQRGELRQRANDETVDELTKLESELY